jgi:hypothetical protein
MPPLRATTFPPRRRAGWWRTFAGLAGAWTATAGGAAPPLTLQNRLEPFVDSFLLESRDNLELRLATPVSAGTTFTFDQPWEGPTSLAGTVIQTDGKYQMFYRGLGGIGETVCYAESRDGIAWTRPSLGRVKAAEFPGNNMIALSAGPRDLDRFSQLGSPTVFRDDRAVVPMRERYKAVRMIGDVRGHGLQVIVSPDGLRWEPYAREAAPFATNYALDTANLITWLPAENCYAVYMRGWTGDRPGVTPQEPNEMGKIAPFFHGVRTVMRSVSTDLIHWTEPAMMSFGDAPREHVYTISAQPYFRAPHILIALPMRFDVEGSVLSEEELKANGIGARMWRGMSDAVFMTSRGGPSFDRTFLEAFVRPGLDPHNWAARSQIVALGVVQTGPAEMSFYVNRAYATRQSHVERMTLRLDGFAALHAGRPGGTATTRPLRLEGAALVLNYSTSMAGWVKVVLLDENGGELPGFGAAEAVLLKGDRLDQPVRWRSGLTLADLRGRTVRIKFVAQDADIFALGVFDQKSR